MEGASHLNPDAGRALLTESSKQNMRLYAVKTAAMLDLHITLVQDKPGDFKSDILSRSNQILLLWKSRWRWRRVSGRILFHELDPGVLTDIRALAEATNRSDKVENLLLARLKRSGLSKSRRIPKRLREVAKKPVISCNMIYISIGGALRVEAMTVAIVIAKTNIALAS